MVYKSGAQNFINAAFYMLILQSTVQIKMYKVIFYMQERLN